MIIFIPVIDGYKFQSKGLDCKIAFRKFSCYSQNHDDNDIPLKSPVGMKGYYIRPSRAIEKGGGFFVPGLEDEKIRLVSGFVIIVLVILNHIGIVANTIQLMISEVITISMAVFLLLQALQFTQQPQKSNQYSDSLSILQTSNKPSSKSLNSEFIAREVLKTCNGIIYILVCSSEEILIEIGSLSQQPMNIRNMESIYRMLTSEILLSSSYLSPPLPSPSSLSSSDLNCLLLPSMNESTSSQISRVTDLLSIPSNKQQLSILSIHNSNQELWLIVSSKSTSLIENKEWIHSLVSVSGRI